MRIRQPGVQRHRRQLDHEGHEEPQHQPSGQRRGNLGAEQLEVAEAEGAGARLMGEGQAQDRDQHQQAAGLGEDEELDRRVDPPFMAPDADQQVHRHQHRFPEHEEQEQIHRQEHAHGAG